MKIGMLMKGSVVSSEEGGGGIIVNSEKCKMQKAKCKSQKEESCGNLCNLWLLKIILYMVA